MKKLLVLLTLICFSGIAVNAHPEGNFPGRNMPPKMNESERAQKESAFEKRLGLTEEQKQKAKELRTQGFENIKPVIEKLKSRELEAEMVKKSKLAPRAQEEKLRSIYKDMTTLKKEAHDIRVKNMKDFENILTTEQKKTLKEMKQEGRKEFKKKHSAPPTER